MTPAKATEYDKVLLQLTNAAGAVPTPEEIAKLDPKAADADAALSKARKALYKEMSGSHAALRVEAEIVHSSAASPPQSLKDFNEALVKLRSVVGAEFKVKVVVKSTSLFLFNMNKADASKDVPTFELVSVLDVAKTKEAKNIFAAEQAVADALAGLSKAIKAGDAAGVKTTLTLKKKKLVPTFVGGEEEDVIGKSKYKPKEKGEEEGEPVGEGEEDGEGEGEGGADAEGESKAEADAEAKSEGEGKSKDEEKGKSKAESKTESKGDAKDGAKGKSGGATEAKSTIRKAVSTANSQLFKLFKAARNANGNINIAKALVALFESLKKKVASLGPDAMVRRSFVVL